MINWEDGKVEELRGKLGNWAVAHIVRATPWTTKDQVVKFGGRDVIVLSQTGDYFPVVAVNRLPGTSYEDDWSFLSSFLSGLSWAFDGRAAVFTFGGGSHLNPMVGFSEHSFDFMPYHQSAFPVRELLRTDGDAALALAFWREGCSLGPDAVPYPFLSFYKMVERAMAGAKRDAWIKSVLPRVALLRIGAAHLAKNELEQLNADGKDVSLYLRQSCRSAIAHGQVKAGDVTSPDDAGDRERVRRSTPIMQCLGYMAAIEIIGVPEPKQMII